jgi:hypothetical protein
MGRQSTEQASQQGSGSDHPTRQSGHSRRAQATGAGISFVSRRRIAEKRTLRNEMASKKGATEAADECSGHFLSDTRMPSRRPTSATSAGAHSARRKKATAILVHHGSVCEHIESPSWLAQDARSALMGCRDRSARPPIWCAIVHPAEGNEFQCFAIEDFQ